MPMGPVRITTRTVALLVLLALPAVLTAQADERGDGPMVRNPSPCAGLAGGEMAPPHQLTAHPNEPAGYRAFAAYDACFFPVDPRDKRPHLGEWQMERKGRMQNMRLIADPTAPGSPPGVIVTRYPKGFEAGRGPVYWNGWDSAGNVRGQKRELYVSIWIKLDGHDFESAPAVTKLGFIGYGQNPRGVGVNQGFFFLKGGAKARIGPSFGLAFEQQNHVDRNLHQNTERRQVMTSGRWHHWEAVLRLNDMGRANGTFEMWVDGTQIMSHRDVVYRTAAQPNGFTMFTWNPTWGGLHATKTREDRVLIDDVYLSGIDLDNRRGAE